MREEDDLRDLLLSDWETALLTPEQQNLERQRKQLAHLDRRAGVLPAPLKAS